MHMAPTYAFSLAHILWLLAAHHILREVAPDVFTTNRISSLIDPGKSTPELSEFQASGWYVVQVFLKFYSNSLFALEDLSLNMSTRKRFRTAMSGTGFWEAPGAVLSGTYEVWSTLRIYSELYMRFIRATYHAQTLDHNNPWLTIRFRSDQSFFPVFSRFQFHYLIVSLELTQTPKERARESRCGRMRIRPCQQSKRPENDDS